MQELLIHFVLQLEPVSKHGRISKLRGYRLVQPDTVTRRHASSSRSNEMQKHIPPLTYRLPVCMILMRFAGMQCRMMTPVG